MNNDAMVYVISDGELHKIGISNNPITRLHSLRSGLKKKLSILMAINCKDARGCEKELHSRFKSYSVGGEWFNFPDRSFLNEVFEVCSQDIVSDEKFYSADYAISATPEVVVKIINSFYLVTYKCVDYFSRGEYSPTVLPQIMKRMGCIPVKVSWRKTKVYITPKGLELGLDKLPKKDLKPYLNKGIALFQ